MSSKVFSDQLLFVWKNEFFLFVTYLWRIRPGNRVRPEFRHFGPILWPAQDGGHRGVHHWYWSWDADIPAHGTSHDRALHLERSFVDPRRIEPEHGAVRDALHRACSPEIGAFPGGQRGRDAVPQVQFLRDGNQLLPHGGFQYFHDYRDTLCHGFPGSLQRRRAITRQRARWITFNFIIKFWTAQ